MNKKLIIIMLLAVSLTASAKQSWYSLYKENKVLKIENAKLKKQIANQEEFEDGDTKVAKKTKMSSSNIIDKIVVCKGDKSVGTGFLTHFKKANIIVTCMHVFMGNKSMKFLNHKNEELKYSSIYVPKDGRDLIFFVLKDQKKEIPLLTISNMNNETVKIGTKIVNYGNNFGEGVITEEKGQILGLGPKKVETDLKNVSGSSGSPILLAHDGKIIAIETYVRQIQEDWTTSNTRYTKKRNFGTRIDTVRKIVKVNIFHYRRKVERINKFNEHLKKFILIYYKLSDNITAETNIFSWWEDYKQLDKLRALLNRQVWELDRQCKKSIPWVEERHKKASKDANAVTNIVNKIGDYLNSITDTKGKMRVAGRTYRKRRL